MEVKTVGLVCIRSIGFNTWLCNFDKRLKRTLKIVNEKKHN